MAILDTECNKNIPTDEDVSKHLCENVPENADCLESPLKSLLIRGKGTLSADEISELSEELRVISYKTDRLARFVARSSIDDRVPEKQKALYKKHLEISLDYKKVLSERITNLLEISNEENENIKKAIEEITESK